MLSYAVRVVCGNTCFENLDFLARPTIEFPVSDVTHLSV